MKKVHSYYILFITFFFTQQLLAQDSLISLKPKPISMEHFIGNDRQFLQLVVNKGFAAKQKIGLLSISCYASDNKGVLNHNEFQHTTLVYVSVFKGIGVNAGMNFTSIEGLKSFLGLQYIYANKTLSFMYMPSYYFIRSHKISNFAMIEYKPTINQNWSVYSRLQLLYNYNLQNRKHFRSYAYSRLGLTYNYISFGFAYNFDRYGADKKIKNNYGLFLKLSI